MTVDDAARLRVAARILRSTAAEMEDGRWATTLRSWASYALLPTITDAPPMVAREGAQ